MCGQKEKRVFINSASNFVAASLNIRTDVPSLSINIEFREKFGMFVVSLIETAAKKCPGGGRLIDGMDPRVIGSYVCDVIEDEGRECVECGGDGATFQYSIHSTVFLTGEEVVSVFNFTNKENYYDSMLIAARVAVLDINNLMSFPSQLDAIERTYLALAKEYESSCDAYGPLNVGDFI